MTLILLMSLMFQERTTSVFVDRIAVKVNDKIITQRELVQSYKDLRAAAMQQMSGADLDAALSQAWEKAVADAEEKLLLFEKAVESGVAYSRDETVSLLEGMREEAGLTMEEFEQEIFRQVGLTMEEFIDRRQREDSANSAIRAQVMSRINFDDAEIAKFYSDNKNDYLIAATYRISEIVFRRDGENAATVDSRVAAAKAALAEGRDFAEVAREFSDSFSKENGGDLGKVEYGDLLPTIEDAVKALNVNDVSDILETPASLFIIKVTEKVDAIPRPLDEVRDNIIERMREPRIEKVLQEFLEELRSEFVVETYIKEMPDYLDL